MAVMKWWLEFGKFKGSGKGVCWEWVGWNSLLVSHRKSQFSALFKVGCSVSGVEQDSASLELWGRVIRSVPSKVVVGD